MTNRHKGNQTTTTHATAQHRERFPFDPQAGSKTAQDPVGEPPADADDATDEPPEAETAEGTADPEPDEPPERDRTADAETARATAGEPSEHDRTAGTAKTGSQPPEAGDTDETAGAGTGEPPEGETAEATAKTADHTDAPEPPPSSATAADDGGATEDKPGPPKTGDPFVGFFDAHPAARLEGKQPTFNVDAEDAAEVPGPKIEDLPSNAAEGWCRTPAEREQATQNHRTGRFQTPGTQAYYYHRAEKQIQIYRKTHDIPEDAEVSYRDFVQWLLGTSIELSLTTWRFYRNAVIAYLEPRATDPDIEEAISLLLADRDARMSVRGGIANEKQPRPERTSAKKSKRVSYQAHENIRAYLTNVSTSSYAIVLRDMIDATLMTGLRPGEWATADVTEVDDKPLLKVLSEKTPDGRGNVLVRTLDLGSLDAEQVAVIRRTAERGRAWHADGVFKKRMDALAPQFSNVVKRAVPNKTGKQLSLYSYRHQFIANAKAAMPLEEVAALVGQADVVTSTTHYGERRSAWGPEQRTALPKATPDEVRRTQQRIEGREHQRLRNSYRKR